MSDFLGSQPVILRVVLLVVIFLLGYFEGFVLKRPEWACATWFVALAALTAWITYPLTVIHICMGSVVLLSGTVVMTIYYKRFKEATPHSK